MGAVAVESGARLSPGNSIDSLETGAATFAAGSVFEYEVDSTDLTNLSAAADLLVVDGDLAIDAGALLSFVDIGTQPGTFVEDSTVFAMINYTGSWNGNGFTYQGETLADGSSFEVDGQLWQIDYDSSTGGLNYTGDYQASSSFVTVTAVPEPSTLVMVSLASMVAAVMAARRRMR